MQIDGPGCSGRLEQLRDGMTVGRSRGNELRLANDLEVGRRQFQVFAQGGTWGLRDLGATNATIIDGVSLKRDQAVALRDGSVVENVDLGRCQVLSDIWDELLGAGR